MQPIVFLDDGGVMSDNERRGEQWRRLVAEFFAPRLGGDPAAWQRANRVVFDGMWAEFLARAERAPDYDPVADRAREMEVWLRGMAAEVGVAAPENSPDCIALSEDAHAFITSRVNAAFPGVPETVRALHSAGFTIYTASGEHSRDLDGYMSALAIRDCFVTLYGPDLVGVPKENPRYYERVFAHAGVAPSEALVVDDSPTRLDSAAATGARTVLCGSQATAPSRHERIRGLPELLALLGLE
ncbi:MAG TPA: HAD-IA family hydrolase [Chloroflexota bacterium]|nr:HAD-IA family hydrolase [Chloroflexota bacterium]